jgi:hypothetical protein
MFPPDLAPNVPRVDGMELRHIDFQVYSSEADQKPEKIAASAAHWDPRRQDCVRVP